MEVYGERASNKHPEKRSFQHLTTFSSSRGGLGLHMQHISSDNSHAEHGTDLFFLSVVAILEIVGSWPFSIKHVQVNVVGTL